MWWKIVIDHTFVKLVVINDDEDLSAAIGALSNNIKSFDPKDLLIAHVQVSHDSSPLNECQAAWIGQRPQEPLTQKSNLL